MHGTDLSKCCYQRFVAAGVSPWNIIVNLRYLARERGINKPCPPGQRVRYIRQRSCMHMLSSPAAATAVGKRRDTPQRARAASRERRGRWADSSGDWLAGWRRRAGGEICWKTSGFLENNVGRPVGFLETMGSEGCDGHGERHCPYDDQLVDMHLLSLSLFLSSPLSSPLSHTTAVWATELLLYTHPSPPRQSSSPTARPGDPTHSLLLPSSPSS